MPATHVQTYQVTFLWWALLCGAGALLKWLQIYNQCWTLSFVINKEAREMSQNVVNSLLQYTMSPSHCVDVDALGSEPVRLFASQALSLCTGLTVSCFDYASV